MEEEKFEQEENVTTNEIQEEIKEEVTEIQEEVTEPVAEDATLMEEVPPTDDDHVENPTVPLSRKRLWIIVAAVIGVLAVAALVYCLTGGCSKYKGYKKDRATGIYYQFFGDIHDTAAMPKTGDLVGILFSLRAGDSVLIPMSPNEMLMDSLYNGDIFSAIRMMHVGDSASFILDGPEFFRHFMQDTVYPFGKDPLYFDVKLYGQMPAAQFQQMRADYEKMMMEKQAEEAESIKKYVADNKINVEPTPEGIYIMTTKKGTGAQPQPMQTVTVHYTGKLLDGTVFDSSVKRGEPFSFMLGARQVIPGWEVAVSKMHVGEKVTVLIPSDFAYGERGNYAIPPFSPLVFDIELLSVKDSE
jgi:FKBP-type peptidyl-prolyl cis-trans isomerase